MSVEQGAAEKGMGHGHRTALCALRRNSAARYVADNAARYVSACPLTVTGRCQLQASPRGARKHAAVQWVATAPRGGRVLQASPMNVATVAQLAAPQAAARYPVEERRRRRRRRRRRGRTAEGYYSSRKLRMSSAPSAEVDRLWNPGPAPDEASFSSNPSECCEPEVAKHPELRRGARRTPTERPVSKVHAVAPL